jgi:proteasome lid subunit RPN8/RPN11
VRVFPGTNTELSPSRYNMDLGEVLQAFNEIHRQGWELGAIFHSHPRTAAEPSQTDLQLAFYPEALTVIVSLAGTEPIVRAYRLASDHTSFEEVSIAVIDG